MMMTRGITTATYYHGGGARSGINQPQRSSAAAAVVAASSSSALSSLLMALRLALSLVINVLTVQSATFNVFSGDSIQDALDSVSPGDVVIIHPGNYFEDIKTRVDGTESERITIKGSEDGSNRGSVVLRGAGGSNYVFEIKHDYYTIENFSIDGEALEDADDDNYLDAYRNKLLYVYANREPTAREGGYRSALDGLIIRDMNLLNAGGECIRLRYFVTDAEIYGNDILNCGVYDFFFDDGGKNGEGIYIGTSSDQWDDNYEDEPDETRGTHVYDNRIETNGNEGVEIKEGCIDTVVEDNMIHMQKDADSGGINSRADGSIIRNNYVEDAVGAGIRLGGNHVDGHQYGVDNQVYGNHLVECANYGLKVMESPQEVICGNTIDVPEGEDEDEYDFTGGEYKDEYDPREPCNGTFLPVPAEPTPVPTESSTTRTPSPVSEPNPVPTESSTIHTPSPVSEPTPVPTESSTTHTPSPVSEPTPVPTESSTTHTPSPVSEPTPVPTESSTTHTPSPVSEPTPVPTESSTTHTPSPVSEPTPVPTEISTTHTPSPISEPTPLPTESSTTNYLGCFEDQRDARTMSFGYRDDENLTNEACIEFCREGGNRFAGTFNKKRCRCTDTEWMVEWHGLSDKCTKKCPGDSTQICGGNWAVSSWRT